LKNKPNIEDTTPSRNFREGVVIWHRNGPVPKRTSLTKKILIYLVITTAVFITLTFYTADLQAASDGDNRWGYPFTFFIEFSGMCDPCPEEPTEMSWWKFLFDIGFAFAMVLILRKALHIIKSRLKNN
jgi:hypothetical protein